MGQYWMPVNLSKREYISPHKLGAGLKLWEQLANNPGVGAALIILTAAQREARGGGDFDMEQNWHGPERTLPKHNTTPGPMPEDYPSIAARTIGRWAGDNIAIVGDYATDSDLPRGYKASRIYSLCIPKIDAAIASYLQDAKTANTAEKRAEARKLAAKYKGYLASGLYTDITDDVVRVIEHELNGKFEGEGWRTWKADRTEQSA